MAPRAAIIVPTRDRPSYLDVALRSLRPQADAAGVELLVVLDGPDPASEVVAHRHGARVVAHDAPRGLNVARNTAAAATDAGLLVFVDDDVEVRPGWLAALLAADAELPEAYGVLTGPVHARFEGHRLRACGREGPPITFLDLGPADADAEHAWGANMAVRRTALDRAGRFDETLGLYGDEQEWQARLKAAGGRLRYVAAAALDHRRAGDDARLRALARAAFRRGVASRRFDVRRGAAPPVGGELRTLAGCAAHVVRFRCQSGIVLTAHSAGRLRALAGDLVAPGGGGPATVGGDDFLSGASGTVGGRRGAVLRVRDRWLDVRGAARAARLRAAARRTPPRRRVVVLAVARPGVPGLLDDALAELRRSRHDVDVRTAAAGSRGKFENLNALLDGVDLAAVDWLLVVDDDVALPRGFLDVLLHVAEAAGLRLAQPAHRLHSHAAWAVTRRRPGVAARRTTFVEIGPVTAFHRETFATLLPFPEGLRMGWGLDVHWAALARERGWPIGVVDATPVGHTLRPAADAYPREAAAAEARAFLAGRPYVRRDEVRTLAEHQVKVVVVAEFYPRAHDPVLGVWAHRQAVAARDAGADVRVLVLHRPVPPRATAPRDALREARRLAAQPRRATLDGLEVRYVPFLAPPRPGHYGAWGAWAAPTLAVALRTLRRRFAFDLVHAHNAVPAADAVLRAGIGRPLLVSEHGADVFHTAPRHPAGLAATRRAFARARLVLANSAGIEAACRALGATRTRVVHLGTDLADAADGGPAAAGPPTLVTVAHLVARKRHADVLRALALLRDHHPSLRWVVVGDGPERAALAALARELGVADRVELAGQLDHPAAVARARAATLFVMPSVDEAFGVAYAEAMAGGVPAVATRGEPGPEELAAAGGGLRLVPPRDPAALAAALDDLLADDAARAALGRAARATVEAHFTWAATGRATVAAYEDALRAGPA